MYLLIQHRRIKGLDTLAVKILYSLKVKFLICINHSAGSRSFAKRYFLFLEDQFYQLCSWPVFFGWFFNYKTRLTDVYKFESELFHFYVYIFDICKDLKKLNILGKHLGSRFQEIVWRIYVCTDMVEGKDASLKKIQNWK